MELYPLDFVRRQGPLDGGSGTRLPPSPVMKGVMSCVGQQRVRIRFFSDRVCFGLRALFLMDKVVERRGGVGCSVAMEWKYNGLDGDR